MVAKKVIGDYKLTTEHFNKALDQIKAKKQIENYDIDSRPPFPMYT